jgi:hypothetical protein
MRPRHKDMSVGTADLATSLGRFVRSLAEHDDRAGALDIHVKGLPAGSALLTLVDEDGIAFQVVKAEERAALKAQFRRATPDLSAAEDAVLRRGGATDEELRLGPTLLAIARRGTEEKYSALVKDSLSVEQAARRLRLSSGRIRQLLLAGQVYGFKQDGDWRIPAFQFQGNKLVPGIGKVMAKVPRSLSLVALYNWLTTSNPDLRSEAEGDEGFTPLEWLRSGCSPEAAALLASAL